MARKKQTVEPAADKNILHKLSPAVALVLGIVLLITGIVLTAVSQNERIIEIDALEKYADNVYIRADGVVDSSYNGQPIITYGQITYEDNSAADTLFGISADSVILYRVSEMYQWTEVDGNVVAVWSEQILESPDSTHVNPTSYPANTKSSHYTARSAKLGDYSLSAEIILMLEETQPLSTLPKIEVRGFYTDGSYLTNAADVDAPEIGDVRISYEYSPAKIATVAGKQRESTIVGYGNYGDTNFFLALEGQHTKSEMIAGLRDAAVDSVVWMLVLGLVLSAVSGFFIFDGVCRLTKYSPTFPSFAKGKEELTAPTSTLVYSSLLGALLCILTDALLWTKTYPIPMLIAVVAATVYFYILIGDMIKNMPRRVKKEAEYVPILIKREDDKRKK